MKESDKRWAFWALACAFLVDFLGYAFIVPILPSWKQNSLFPILKQQRWFPLGGSIIFAGSENRSTDRPFGSGQNYSCLSILFDRCFIDVSGCNEDYYR